MKCAPFYAPHGTPCNPTKPLRSRPDITGIENAVDIWGPIFNVMVPVKSLEAYFANNILIYCCFSIKKYPALPPANGQLFIHFHLSRRNNDGTKLYIQKTLECIQAFPAAIASVVAGAAEGSCIALQRRLMIPTTWLTRAVPVWTVKHDERPAQYWSFTWRLPQNPSTVCQQIFFCCVIINQPKWWNISKLMDYIWFQI